MPRAARPALLYLLLVMALAASPAIASARRKALSSHSAPATVASASTASGAWSALTSLVARLLGGTDATVPTGHTQTTTSKPVATQTSDLGGTMDPDG